MEPDNVKRKISEEIDSSAEHEFSEDVRSEIESNAELKKFADDIVKIEALLEDLSEQTGRDFDPAELRDRIAKAVREAPRDENGKADAYLSEPMPETGDEKESRTPREPAFTFPAVSTEEAAAFEEGKKDQDPMRLTARRLTAGAAGDDSSGLINLGALVQEHRESQAPPVSDKAAAMPGLPPPSAKKGKRTGMYVMIAIFAVVGIAAIIQIGRMARNKASLEQGGIETTAMDKEAIEAELKAELMASMKEDEKAAQEKAEQQEPGLSVSEEEAQEGEETGEHEGAGILLAKKSKKKSGAGHETVGSTEPSPAAVKTGGAQDEGEKTVDTKDKSQKDLMSLLDSATAKKQPAEGSEKPAKKGGGPSVEELMGEGKKDTPKESEQDASLPATLSKNQIRAVMQKLNTQIMKCGEGKVGNLILNLVVSNDGSVKSAKASGEFANDPTGKCAENVAKGAKFPPFKNPTMNVTYPYRFTPPPGI
jgi:hypothetical protein